MKKRWFSLLLLIFVLFYTPCSAAMVPFAIPGQENGDSLIAIDSEPIGFDGFNDRISATGDHFTRGGQRIKFWGVNFSFGGNFPSHADAEVSAQRLAAAGINSVRLHHTDTLNYPNGIWNPTNGQTIYAEALDRLDYYINELAENGIYVNLNLHIGREHSQYLGLPTPNTDYDKIVGIFTPALINTQKGYAQQMLNHVNPYRGMRVADDPAIAFVEITNEDSFFMWDGPQKLRSLPSYYADILKQQYNDWLGEEYGDTDTLRNVWNANVEPLGPNVLTSFDDNFNNPGIDPADKWYLEEHEGCDANFEFGTYQSQTGAKFTIYVTDTSGWHLQIRQSNLQLVEGQFYTLSFEAAAESPRTISLNVMQHHDPWAGLGLYASANLTTSWQTYTYTFTATGSDTNGRVTFSFCNGDTTTFYMRNAQLRTGGQTGLMEDEFIETGTVRMFVDTAVQERTIDQLRFLAETEKAYFDDMRSYIKNDLSCDSLVTGTIVFGPLGLYAQSDMDFIDAHSYWQHPQFPGTPWDPANWFIEQRPMVDYINSATLFGLAGCRLGKSGSYAGKPFTVTEYNHSAPLDSQAECVPMLASFAAAQDWDGLWLYAYTHSRDDWYDNFFNGFFDIIHNPAKWGFVRAGASIFRYGAIGPAGSTYSFAGLTDPCDPLPGLATLYQNYNSDMWGILASKTGTSRSDLLNSRVVNTLFDTGVIDSPDYSSQTAIDWQIGTDGKGAYTATGKACRVYVGHKEKFQDVSGGTIEVNEPNYVAMTVTTLEPNYTKNLQPLKHRFLITACGRSENTGMIFSSDRRTVGTNWGYAPVLIEPVSATIKFPFKGLSCYALLPDGTISREVATRIENGQTVIEILPAYGTMWYLVTVSGDLDGDGTVTFEDFCKLGQYWMQAEPSVDIAPLPYGDGVADYEDLAVFTDTWLLDINP